MASATARPAGPPSSATSTSPGPYAAANNRLPKPSTNGVASAPAASESNTPDQHAHDRLLFLFANFIGCQADVTLTSGERFSGIFSTPSLDAPDLRYALKMAKRAPSPQANGAQSESAYVGSGDDHLMLFDVKDVVDLHCANVALDKVQARATNGAAGFRTDTDISGNLTRNAERELQRWEPAESNVNVSFGNSSRGGTWDQFEANERLYGIKTDYSEDLYTTSINKSDPSYAKRVADAERIAREIEGTVSSNIHVAEERGHIAEGSKDVDEEERYSGVVRPASSSNHGNRYTPPAMRAPTGHTTVSGAPVDPAIISSQLKAPDSQSQPKTAKPQDARGKENAALAVPSSNHATKSTKPGAHTLAQNASQNASQHGLPEGAKGKDRSPPTPAPAPANATQNVERDVLRSFKAFSADEKLKMQERQRAQARKEKDIKLNDLKKFAINFKLKTNVPHDMLGILAKDKQKQFEIAEKAKRQVHEASVEKEKEKEKEKAKASGSSASAAQTPVAPVAAPAPTTEPRGPRTAQNTKPPASGAQQKGAASGKPAPGSLAQRLSVNMDQQLKQQQQQQQQPPPPPPPQQQQSMVQPSNAAKGVPTGPSAGVSDNDSRTGGSLTPSSSVSARFNVRAMEFRPNPAAVSFSPTSQARAPSSPANSIKPPGSASGSRQSHRASFWPENKRPSGPKKPFSEAFNPIRRLKEEVQRENKAKDYVVNGGIPQAYRTIPTWDFPEANQDKSYLDMFEKTTPQAAMVPGNGPMPHHHQLPPHLQPGMPGAPQMHMQPQGPQSFTPSFGQQNEHRYDGHQMHMSSSNSPAYPSPRFQPGMMMQPSPMMGPAQPAGYNGQQYVMGPNGQPMFARPAGPGQQQFMAQGQPMATPMMVSHSGGAPFMSMPMHQGSVPVYAPAQGHMYPGGPPAPAAGYPSPRGAPMMIQQGSQQGHMPQYMVMAPGQPGQPVYAPHHAQQMHVRPGMPMQHSASYGSPHMNQHYAPQPHRGPPFNGQQFHQQQQHHQQSQPQPQMSQGPPATAAQTQATTSAAAAASTDDAPK